MTGLIWCNYFDTQVNIYIYISKCIYKFRKNFKKLIAYIYTFVQDDYELFIYRSNYGFLIGLLILLGF